MLTGQPTLLVRHFFIAEAFLRRSNITLDKH